MVFTTTEVQKVWEKGTVVPGYDPKVWRKDACTAWINRAQYGNRQSIYGWEVDHIDPNGGDGIDNLRPLQWANNVAKGDSSKWTCAVVSQGTQNVRTG